MILIRRGIQVVVICGVQTPNCIRSTATNTVSFEDEVILLEEAIAAQIPEVHKVNAFLTGLPSLKNFQHS